MSQNDETKKQLVAAWAFFYTNITQHLGCDEFKPQIKLLYNQFEVIRSAIAEAHPDSCQICNEIVPDSDRICNCSYILCLQCAGKCANLECPHCKTPGRFLELVAEDKLQLSFSAMIRHDNGGFKPELVRLLESRQQENGSEEREELIADLGIDMKQQEHLMDEIEEQNHEESDSQEAEPQNRNEPTIEVEGLVRRQSRETRIEAEIDALLEFCMRHNNQRSFTELMFDLSQVVSWNHRSLDTREAREMDIATITNQFFIALNIVGNSKEARFLSFLRQGEFFDRLHHLGPNETLNYPDEHGNAQHCSSAFDYLRRRFGLKKKDENNLRSCYQFFEVWKEFHPIISISQSEWTWSWLVDALTRNKLLEKVRIFNREQREVRAQIPVPLPYRLPEGAQDYPRPGAFL
jgi:hypothetical protein